MNSIMNKDIIERLNEVKGTFNFGRLINNIKVVDTGGKNHTFTSTVSLNPIPGMENYSALIYTFFTRNELLTDLRIRDHAPNAYCILFPSN